MYYIRVNGIYTSTELESGDLMTVGPRGERFWIHRGGKSLFMKQNGDYVRVFSANFPRQDALLEAVEAQYGKDSISSQHISGWEEVQDPVGWRLYVQGRRKFRAKPVENP